MVPTQPLSLQELLQLNDQLLSLCRMQLPLESNLAWSARSSRTRVERMQAAIEQRLQSGESLDSALEGVTPPLPALYIAVVRAGLKAGRLGAAIQSLSEISRETLELRALVRSAMVYPLCVMTMAYGMALIFLQEAVTRFETFHTEMMYEPGPFLRLLMQIRDTMHIWAWIPPAALLLLGLWWVFSSAARVMGVSPFLQPLSYIPGFVGASREMEYSELASITALLVEHETPLPESLKLAAETLRAGSLQRSTIAMAEHISRGSQVDPTVKLPGMPQLLAGVLSGRLTNGSLTESLRGIAGFYRDRSRIRMDAVQSMLPTVAVVVLGGGAVLAYALLLVVPLVELWGTVK